MEKKDNIPKLIQKILANRGIETEAEQQDFLNPDYEKSKHDPFLFPNMKKAVNRITAARENNEKITIYGDYDIDGMTATVILWDSFQKLGLNVATYTPDRFTEGYGLNIAAIEKIAADGTKLIITVDNGTLSFDEIARAKELGVDVIVTDHHSPHDELPDAAAILNPKVLVAQNPGAYDEKFVLKKPNRETFLDEDARKILAKYSKFDDGRIDYTSEKICYVVNCSIVSGNEILLTKRSEKVGFYPNTWNGISGFYDELEKSVEEIVAKELCEELSAPEDYEIKVGEMFTQKDEEIGREWRVFPVLAESREKFEPRINWENKSAKWTKIASAKRMKLMPNYGETMRRALELRKNSQKSVAEKVYPFADLAGCGVAFKLVQALQTVFDELPAGQEKWLLDLVALGTVCDIVGLVDENRANVKWGLEVLKKTRRPGLRAILATAGVDPANIDAQTLGFVIGPRLNSAGRMETAEIALELLKTDDNMRALELAEYLENLNKKRRKVQDEIFSAAVSQVVETDAVAIAVGDNWHEGVIGIVAAKILEKFERPAFVMSRGAEFGKASGRSFGEFSIAAAIHGTDAHLVKGGGHLAAGGLTIETTRINEWRVAIQEFYAAQNLTNQKEFLYPKPDVTIDNFAEFTPELLDEIAKLEPFGQHNPAPVFEISPLLIMSRRTMGAGGEHVRYTFADNEGRKFTTVAFGCSEKFTLSEFDDNDEPQHAKILVELMKNEWNGQVKVEGRLIRLDKTD